MTMTTERTIYTLGIVAVISIIAGSFFGKCPDAAMSSVAMPEATISARPSVIVSLSGAPMIIYDPDRLRILLIDQPMPRGMEVCMHKICLLDTEWAQLAEEHKQLAGEQKRWAGEQKRAGEQK